MSKTIEKVHTRRIVALIFLSVTVCILFSLRAFQFQIVNGEDFLQDAQRGSSTTFAVSAARGEIIDCNGVTLTSNRASFHLELDYVLLPKGNDAINEVIYRLIRTFEELGGEWIDDLPITAEEPYQFRDDVSASDIARMKEKMAGLGTEMADYATAEDCLYWLYRSYGIVRYQVDGVCTHCGQAYESCEFESYPEEYARKIAGVRYGMLNKDFSSVNTRYTFAEDVSAESVAWLKEQASQYPGMSIVEKAVRDYLSGDVASHLLGTVGPIQAGEYEAYREQTELGYQMNDIVGRSGVEKAFESELRGTNGEMTVYLDSQNQVIRTEESKTPVAGNTVQLTIDSALQAEVQQIFSDWIEWYNTEYAPANPKNKGEADEYIAHADAGAIVMLDVKTGAAKAIVTYPYYDILDYVNNYSEVASRTPSPLNNRALNGLYRPGSTFKPIVATAALAEDLQTAATTILCPASGLYTYWEGFTPGCLKDRHWGNAELDLRHALEYSCNIYFYDTGRRLGIDRMEEYAHLFGLGVDTGLEIPSAVGHVSSGSDPDWQVGNVVQAAIGQMNTQVTPLQMAAEAMTLANHGVRYETHLVQNILSFDGSEVVRAVDPVVAATVEMSDEAWQAIRDGMVNAGLTIAAPNQLTDLGYAVAVKTGTPQKNNSQTHHAFICFAPADDPEIAIACMLEDGYGTQRMIRQLLLAWEKSKNGGELPARFQVLDGVSSEPAISDQDALEYAAGIQGTSSAESAP